ncbi:MAG: hypothetical protein JWM74_2030 [Myxococcaceae bacterium]|nr:hypothetical protein [Myxococcaceae bacterium]
MTPFEDQSGSAFLASMRRAHDPPPHAKQRVRASILASLPLSVPPTAPLPATPAATTVWTSLAAVVGTAVVIAGVSMGAFHMLRSSVVPPSVPAPSAVVVAPPLPALSTVAAPARPPESRGPSPSETSVVRRARIAATGASSASPVSEVSLVRAAHVARENGDPTAALTYLATHARDFPRGTLVEERELETVLALCALGRVDEARAKASAFDVAFPSSAHADRVARSCARSRHEPASERALTP